MASVDDVDEASCRASYISLGPVASPVDVDLARYQYFGDCSSSSYVEVAIDIERAASRENTSQPVEEEAGIEDTYTGYFSGRVEGDVLFYIQLPVCLNDTRIDDEAVEYDDGCGSGDDELRGGAGREDDRGSVEEVVEAWIDKASDSSNN